MIRTKLLIERETDDEGNRTCGVFIPLPLDLARFVDPKLTGDDSVPHITALFAGSLSAEDYAKLVESAQDVARHYSPFYLDVGCYDEMPSGNHIVGFAPVKSRAFKMLKPGVLAPLLNAMHQDLVTAAKVRGLKPAHNYVGSKSGEPAERFKPHVTLAKLDKKGIYKKIPPGGSFLVDHIEVWGWERIQLPLGHLHIDQPHG